MHVKCLLLYDNVDSLEKQLAHTINDELQLPAADESNTLFDTIEEFKDLFSSISEKKLLNLANNITSRKVSSTMSDVEKYQYLKDTDADVSSFFKKQIQKDEQSKTLT